MRLRLFPFVLAVLAYHLATSVLAWAAGWPPQFGGNPDPEQSYLGYLLGGSAISAPVLPLIVLLLGGLFSRLRRPWRIVGLFMIGIVSVLFLIGIFGEFVAEHPHVPAAAVFGFGAFGLLLSATMLYLVSKDIPRSAGTSPSE